MGITPLMFQQQTMEPVTGLRPYTALELEGRDIYIREGCGGCHSQMIRPFRAETERYGHYSDEWHRVHLLNPRNVVPESNMPGFPWLAENTLNGELTAEKMEVFRGFGVPYTDEDIAGAKAAVQGKTEMQALIAYLQSLGTHLK